jgi:hypothetical protein
VGVPGAVVRSRGGDAVGIEAAGDRGVPAAGKALAKDPLCDRSGLRIGLETIQRRTKAGLLRVRVSDGGDEAVTVRRTAAEVAATGAGHRRHRCAHSSLDPRSFGLAEPSEQ